MADDPRASGPVGMPSIDGAMNKTVPKADDGGKGGKDDKKALALGKDKDEADDQKIIKRASKRLDRCISAETPNRAAALDDLKMKSGDQWPADVKAQRNLDRRPCLTINKLKTFVHQITNDQRQNRPTIRISPVGDRSDPKAAEIYSGLVKAIERDSAADIAYDTAFDSAVSIGFGYFRLITDYESPDTFDQVLKIIRVRNPMTVYLDPNHVEPDGADCRYAFVTEMMARDEFEEKYPDADPIHWDKGGIGDTLKTWITKNEIRVAEYFEIKNEHKKVVALSNGWEGYEDQLSDDAKELIDTGLLEIERERETEVPSVKWYRMTAKEILERKDWVGRWIPIFPVIGDEIDIEGKVTLSGIIRDAKSPQQMYNYWSTQLTEMVALAPKSPFVVEEGQIEGHETEWQEANTKSLPYLSYKGTNINGTLAPPPQRQPPPAVPAGIQQAMQNTANDLMAVTGIRFDSTPQERMFDESGKAIHLLAQRSELANFHYIDNLTRTLRHLGRCLIDAIPKVYDNKRVLTILREDDTEERVSLDPTGPSYAETKGANGKTMKVFNPKQGEYGVAVVVGPSFATKRAEASNQMIAFAKSFPQTGEALADLIAKNQDWPGAQEMTTRLAKIVAMKFPGIMTPDMKDVPPHVQAILSQMDQSIKQLTMERQALLMQLNDKNADRAVAREQIERSFEAKIIATERHLPRTQGLRRRESAQQDPGGC